MDRARQKGRGRVLLGRRRENRRVQGGRQLSPGDGAQIAAAAAGIALRNLLGDVRKGRSGLDLGPGLLDLRDRRLAPFGIARARTAARSPRRARARESCRARPCGARTRAAGCRRSSSSLPLTSRPTTFCIVIVWRICVFRSSRVIFDWARAASNSASVARLYCRLTRSTASSTSSSVACDVELLGALLEQLFVDQLVEHAAPTGVGPTWARRSIVHRISNSLCVIGWSLTRATSVSISSAPKTAAAQRSKASARSGLSHDGIT